MKSSIIKIIISLVFLALFNALFFLLGGTKHTDIEWVSYGFIVSGSAFIPCIIQKKQ